MDGQELLIHEGLTLAAQRNLRIGLADLVALWRWLFLVIFGLTQQTVRAHDWGFISFCSIWHLAVFFCPLKPGREKGHDLMTRSRSQPRFAQCEHVIAKLMQRGEQMEPAASATTTLHMMALGYGSKLNQQETAGFSPCFDLPGIHFGYLFLTHSLFGWTKL